MSGFVPVAASFAGSFTVAAAVARVFPLFSPLGERAWVPGWNPELLHPPQAEWEEEMSRRATRRSRR